MRRLLQHPFVRRHLSLAAILRALRQPILLIGLLATVCLWGFAEIADAVGGEGDAALRRANPQIAARSGGS